ncbi:MAG: hypothetical protein KDD02_15910 [Phaeodactylibacter sp.]|nr:hypothetical protein [Phaeodactylibacter sp.]MCB9303020.1 hypothetical protein [Lewinellaceae bacterium]
MPKKKPKKGNPEVHKDLKGFDIRINEFGEIISNFEVDKLNEFLNENVEDKKLREREEGEPAGLDEEE